MRNASRLIVPAAAVCLLLISVDTERTEAQRRASSGGSSSSGRSQPQARGSSHGSSSAGRVAPGSRAQSPTPPARSYSGSSSHAGRSGGSVAPTPGSYVPGYSSSGTRGHGAAQPRRSSQYSGSAAGRTAGGDNAGYAARSARRYGPSYVPPLASPSTRSSSASNYRAPSYSPSSPGRSARSTGAAPFSGGAASGSANAVSTRRASQASASYSGRLTAPNHAERAIGMRGSRSSAVSGSYEGRAGQRSSIVNYGLSGDGFQSASTQVTTNYATSTHHYGWSLGVGYGAYSSPWHTPYSYSYGLGLSYHSRHVSLGVVYNYQGYGGYPVSYYPSPSFLPYTSYAGYGTTYYSTAFYNAPSCSVGAYHHYHYSHVPGYGTYGAAVCYPALNTGYNVAWQVGSSVYITREYTPAVGSLYFGYRRFRSPYHYYRVAGRLRRHYRPYYYACPAPYGWHYRYGYGYTRDAVEYLTEEAYREGYEDGAKQRTNEERVPFRVEAETERRPFVEGASSLSDRSIQAFRIGDYERATEYAKDAVVAEPFNVNAKLRLGHSAFAAGRYTLAAFALRQALALEGELSRQGLNRLDGYEDAAVFELHQRRLLAAIKSAPNNTELRFLAAYNAYFLGDFDTAARDLEALLLTHSTDEQAKLLYAAALDRLAEEGK